MGSSRRALMVRRGTNGRRIARARGGLLAGVLVVAVMSLPRLCDAGKAARGPGGGDCAALAEILSAAPHQFRALEGPPKHEGLGMWHATVSFPGGRDCLVYAPRFRMYGCSLYVGDDASDADAAYHDAVARVRRCLPKGWTVKERVNGLRTLTKASRNRASPTIFIVSTISDAAAYVVDLSIDLPIR